MKQSLLFSVLLLLLLPASALARPIIVCHCFQERSFNPARPAATDPYLLATVQNSLMAARFGLVKREVVKEKMSGISGEELWVAHYLAERVGMPSSLLLTTRDRNGSWQAAAALLNVDPIALAPRFAALLAEDAGDGLLAAVVVDEVLTTRLAIPVAEVEQIRAQGGSNAELILASYLGRRTGRSPVAIYDETRARRVTWGQLLEATGDMAGTIEEDIRRLLE